MEPIAIIGMGCRFPSDSKDDIDTPSSLWDFLLRKGDAYTDFPSERVHLDAWYHPQPGRPGSFYTRGGCFLKGNPWSFDPSMFGISPQEARTLDPAQRKLLETVYEAFEASGTPLSKLRKSLTGCFIGNFNYDHQLMQFRDAAFPEPYSMTGGGLALLSNRISYIFDLHGPSLTLDTACSSSVYALHLACSAIQSGECTAAIVGGSNLILSPECQLFSAALGAVSKSSKCHTFDVAADGYARAEGIAVLYIKKLSQAILDKDPIRAVIRATAINANGRTAGITHPSPDGQERAIRSAYKRAGDLNPALTSYFECHGTGTPVGDPLEVEAVGRVFAANRSPEEPLLIGSIKSNMGHCESASGIAGIIKAVLSIENRTIPPIRVLHSLNPNIDLKGGCLKIVQDVTPWPENTVRRVSVNSFGYGGSNAHAIIEEVDILAPSHGKVTARSTQVGQQDKSRTFNLEGLSESHPKSGFSQLKAQHPSQRYFLLPFSAHNEQTLRCNIAKLIPQTNRWDPFDLIYTLGHRRTTFASRSYVIATEEQFEGNAINAQDLVVLRAPSSRTTRLGFVFTGQGAQWPQMGKDLMEVFHVFLNSIRSLDKVLSRLRLCPDWTIEEALRAPPELSHVYETSFSQPLITAVQIALVDLLASWNISPAANVGHSSGEIAAAYAAGLLSAAEAIVVAYTRGRAITMNTQNGRMLAIGIGAEAAEPLLVQHPSITIACHNSAASTTLSGNCEDIFNLKDILDTTGIFTRILETGNNAYHSYHMNAVGEGYMNELQEMLEFLQSKQRVAIRPRSLFVSSVTNSVHAGSLIERVYWRENLESPVLFKQALETLIDLNAVDFLIELGPHTTLRGPIRQITKDLNSSLDYIATLIRADNGAKCILSTAATLWTHGHPVNFEAISSAYFSHGSSSFAKSSCGSTIVNLPRYQWVYNETFHWENRWSREWRLKTHLHHDLLGSRQQGCNQNEPLWRNVLKLEHLSWLRDHRIGSDIVFPAAGYVFMAIEAAVQMTELNGTPRTRIRRCDCEDLHITSPLILSENTEGIEVLLNLRRSRVDRLSYHPSRFAFTITSVTRVTDKDIFTEHVSGNVLVATEADQSSLLTHNLAYNSDLRRISTNRWYDAFERVGLNYGPAFNCLSSLGFSDTEGGAEGTLFPTIGQENLTKESDYFMHPTMLDGALQLAIIAAYKGKFVQCDSGYVPVSITRLSIMMAGRGQGSKKAIAYSHYTEAKNLVSNVSISNNDGSIALEIGGLKLTRLVSKHQQGLQTQANEFSRCIWKPDIDLLTVAGTLRLYETVEPYDPSVYEQLAMYLMINFHAEHPDIFARGSTNPDLQRFLNYMIDKINIAKEDGIPGGYLASNQTVAERRNTIDYLASQAMEICQPKVRLLFHLFESYPRVFAGEISGIGAAVQGDRLSDLYEHLKLFRDGSHAIRDLVELQAHKFPYLKILEIGAGTGSATREVLQGLRGDTDFRGYESYTFTDVTPYFLTKAETTFQQYKGVNYAPFDMDRPAGQQGFEREYDLLIASNVIHATSNVQEVLQNIRSLLKPGGKLCLFEITRNSIGWTALLGTFSGSWKGDKDPTFPRTEGPFLAVSMWHDVLLRCGFSGVDIAIDHFTKDKGAVAFLSTACETSFIPAKISSEHLALVYTRQPPSFVTEFQKFANTSGYLVDMIPFDSVPSLINGNVISLVEIDHPLFASCSREEWAWAKEVLVGSYSVLWVTNGGLLNGGEAEYAMIGGLVAATHAEDRSSRTLTLDLDPDGTSQEEQFSIILKLHSMALEHTPGDDFEFRTKAGVVHISRLLNDEALNSAEIPDEFLMRSGQTTTWIDPAISHQKYPCGALDGIAAPKARPSEPKPPRKGSLFHPDAAYLLVGCLGGLGRSFASWAVLQGARHLVFLARSGISSKAAAKFVTSLQAAGAKVHVVKGDVTSPAAISEALQATEKPVKGIVQAALLLKDSFLSSMTFEDFNTTMRPRVLGTLNLHNATRNMDLDFFLMWSSWTRMLGSASQANYMASSAFMDAFATRRQHLGVPATSLCLGQILDVGIVSERLDYQEHLMRIGLYGNSENDFLRFCEVAISPRYSARDGNEELLGQGYLLAGIEPVKLLANARRYPLDLMNWYTDPRFSHLLLATSHVAAHSSTAVTLTTKAGADDNDVNESLPVRVHRYIARSLYMAPQDLDESRPINNFGLDSLVAVQLRHWILRTFEIDFTLLHLLSSTLTVKGLVAEIKEVTRAN